LGASTSASLSQQHLASGDDTSPEDDEEVCPICCENIDDTDKAFFPCPCGFQPCMFCYNKIVEIGDARCPACRRTYGSTNGDEAEESSSSDDDDDDTSNSDSSSDGPAAGAKAGAAASARVTGRARK
jgi:CCR4-NOT transcription complex subunit 4